MPICPIASIGGDTYEVGYNRGYEKATVKKAIVISESDKNSKDVFCEGWEKGYKVAMNENDKGTFIVPICPIAMINEDDYDAGYLKGYQKALDKLGKVKEKQILVVGSEEDTFCEGWDRGYQLGLQEWANDNNERKPNRYTPFCPSAKMNYDTYQAGFDRGRQKAFDDMK